MNSLKLEPSQEEGVRILQESAIVVDMCHATRFDKPNPVIGSKGIVERAKEGGLTIACQTLVGSAREDFRDAIEEINLVNQLLETDPDNFMLITEPAHMQEAKDSRKIGLIIHFQDATPLEDDWLNTLPVFDKLGVRIIQLTYNEQNLLGSGCLEPVDSGLTAYGAQVVRGLNRHGIMIDLSHVGDKTAADAIDLSNDPVLFTHANPKKLNSSPRNKPDSLLKACAEKGGLVGVVGWAVIATIGKNPAPTIEDYFTHIDYLVDLIGIDHVGIGADINETFRVMPIRSTFEAIYSFMLEDFRDTVAPALENLSRVEHFSNITKGLVKRGYSDEDVKKILGGNFVRVAEEVWKK